MGKEFSLDNAPSGIYYVTWHDDVKKLCVLGGHLNGSTKPTWRLDVYDSIGMCWNFDGITKIEKATLLEECMNDCGPIHAMPPMEMYKYQMPLVEFISKIIGIVDLYTPTDPYGCAPLVADLRGIQQRSVFIELPENRDADIRDIWHCLTRHGINGRLDWHTEIQKLWNEVVLGT